MILQIYTHQMKIKNGFYMKEVQALDEIMLRPIPHLKLDLTLQKPTR